MIQANELRIGNWVKVIKSVAVKITADHIKSISEGDNDYSPIELTQEILEKCGFKNNNRSIGFQNIEVKDGVASVYDPHIHASNTDFPCKYLHQLQNIFFALMEEELIYKP